MRSRPATAAGSSPSAWEAEPIGSTARRAWSRRSTAPTPRPPRRSSGSHEAAGGSAFTEDDVGGASDALREAAEQGPVADAARHVSTRALAPYLAGLAALLAVVTALSRTLRGDLRRQVSAE